MTHEERKNELKGYVRGIHKDDDYEKFLDRYVLMLMDDSETDTYIRNRVRGILTDFEIDGDSWGVPALEDIVDRLCEMIFALQKK